MTLSLDPVSVDEKEILRNLLEKYLYEFSQYDLGDVNALGLYGYAYLDNYWTEDNRWAFFIRVDGRLAGFAMVNDIWSFAATESTTWPSSSSCTSTVEAAWDAGLPISSLPVFPANGS